MSEKLENTFAGILITFVTLAVIFGLIIGIIGLISFGNNFGRNQARKDAANNVKIAHIYIQKAHEEALINYAEIEATKAAAKKRIVESEGLAAAQRLIDNTLTPLYIQHEAIQAQKDIATSGQNNTVIYVPAGTNGTPVITQGANGVVPGHTR